MTCSSTTGGKEKSVHGTTARWFMFLVVNGLLVHGLRADVLVTTGGTRYDGQILDLGGEYQLTDSKGGQINFPKANVVRVEKGSSLPGPTSTPGFGSRGGSTMDISGLTGANAQPAGNERLMERVVTGSGTDPDKAIQSAFSLAIESTVGVLVDAETIVKNDQIIKDQILTFSRGFVQRFDVLKQWQADGLYYATIKAVVETGKLTAKLKANNIATYEVPGELHSRNFQFEIKNEEGAAEMLKKVLNRFDMTKIVRVELLGKPEITREGSGANIRIKVNLSPDQTQWNAVAGDLRRILSKTSTKHAEISTSHKDRFAMDKVICPHGNTLEEIQARERLKQQLELKHEEPLVGLFKNSSIDGSRMEWEVFRVPETLVEAIAASGLGKNYQVVYSLLDKQGTEVVRTTGPVKFQECNAYPALLRNQGIYPLNGRWVGPVWVSVQLGAVMINEATISISQEDLSRVAKVTVSLERAKD